LVSAFLVRTSWLEVLDVIRMQDTGAQ
jgi:hypothetical protein